MQAAPTNPALSAPAFSAYVFEANAIQKFVLEGGRLRDMVGASHLVEGLCCWPDADGAKDLVQSVLDAVDLAGDSRLEMPRRAGGALVLLHPSRPHLERFRRLWTLSLRLHAPALDFTDSIGAGADPLAAVQDAYTAMRCRRSIKPATLPVIGPMMAVAPHTGRAAVARRHDELLDGATTRKRLDVHRDGTLLPDKIGLVQGWTWPVLLDRADDPTDSGAAFPFVDDNRYLAVIHADGNSLGKVVGDLSETLAQAGRATDYSAVFSRFSRMVDEVTRKAVAQATEVAVLPFAVEQVVPMRPLVVGGDDVTVIVRADLAVAFTVAFLKAFRQLSHQPLAKLKQELDLNCLPDELTAGAGLVFAKARQPFYRAYDLCETLAAEAKRVGKENGGLQCLAFHRVTTMVPDTSWAALRRNLTRDGLCLGMGAYAVDDPAGGVPTLAALLRLRDMIVKTAGFGGPLREIAAQMHDGSRASAQAGYARWRQVWTSRSPDDLQAFDAHLADLGVTNQSALPITADGRTPIWDAVTLAALSGPLESE